MTKTAMATATVRGHVTVHVEVATRAVWPTEDVDPILPTLCLSAQQEDSLSNQCACIVFKAIQCARAHSRSML